MCIIDLDSKAKEKADKKLVCPIGVLTQEWNWAWKFFAGCVALEGQV
jgi:hypothetical protein